MVGASAFESTGLWAVVGIALLAMLYAAFLTRQVLRWDKGTARMQEISDAISEGANAYLRRQFRAILSLIVFLTVALYLTAALADREASISIGRAAAFLMGSLFSATVGFLGMNMAVQGNVRVASAARTSFHDALRISYRAGTVTGMLTDGLGLLGGTLIFILYGANAPEVLLGFGFGGTLLALFMRVGGGIYTKAADVGADLVGKVEHGIPEDDPRNAAVIADLVGDNVGDCAGMAADIFESYEVTMVSAMILGLALSPVGGPVDLRWIVFPLLVRGIGVVSSIIGTYAVSWWPVGEDAFKAMDYSYDLSSVISTVSFGLLAHFYVGDMRVFWSTAAGILLAVGFNKYTSYFTHPHRTPVQRIAHSAETGAATLLLRGMAVGLESSVWALMIIALTIFASIVIYGGDPNPTFVLYGVAMAGIGMLTHTGNNVSMDVFGPISDNAQGITEMADLDPRARQIMTDLDAVGNTTKAITKGIAIASAVLAAVSLFGSFITDTAIIQREMVAAGQLAVDQVVHAIDLADPRVFVGLLVGGAVPFLFSSLAILAVGRAAGLVVNEVRRQFRIPGLMEGKVKPEYGRVVDIVTTAAQRELLSLAIIAIFVPVAIGFIMGEWALGGFNAGIIVSGQLMAVFLANTGGAWDNAKKVIEDGLFGGKGTPEHEASVIGDTVGDPLKDTAGPALNPMIKVVNLVSLLILPIIVREGGRFTAITVVISLACLALVVWAIMRSKQEEMPVVAEGAPVEAAVGGE
ncbi:MAG: sodium-translocating pyrophosphatase [Anaerolineae bacterium]|nr:sodium-translocating pyrophosphatase [Anaerolineae bacterium]